jgi:hypothetical protein
VGQKQTGPITHKTDGREMQVTYRTDSTVINSRKAHNNNKKPYIKSLKMKHLIGNEG